MKKTIFLLCFGLLMIAQSFVSAATPLEQGFQTPPDAVRPGVYWYWINDNISREGVVKDLESMAEVGIGRAFIGNIGEQDGIPYGPHKILSDEWWAVIHEAFKTGTRLNIEMGIFNSPGWSQSGGPWVKPEQSMRYLAFSEVQVRGPQKINQKIAAPGDDFQDVKTLAFKLPEGKTQFFTMEKPEIQSGKTLDFDLDFTPRSMVFHVSKPTSANIEIQTKTGSDWTTIKKVSFDRSNPTINVGFLPFAPAAISIPEAETIRLVFTNINGGPIEKIEISSLPMIQSFAEKTLAKMWPTPLPLWGAYMWPDAEKVSDQQLLIDPKQILDVSEYLQKDGTFTWDVPEGTWIIQRTGMLTTGVKNSPATDEAKGLEIDKMSKDHAAYHFNSYMGEILRRIPAEDRKTWKVVVQDSYETGGQNWTDTMIDDFKQRYGYDPVPFIPVMNGHVVGNPDLSDRFLWDVRRMVADKVAYDYVGGLRDIANQHGLVTWLECYGHWGFPGEFLQYGGQSNEIAGEFWNEGDLGSIENRAASSCGHIYGKTRITAESFTAAGRVYERYPALLKKRCDWSYTEGINDTLLHLYIHQPYEERTPGINAWFATEFNRKNTWFKQMKPFVDYMRRCMFMLQQGLNVADVAYFIGEDAPKMTGVCDPPLPKGYSFDYINGEVIRDSLSVKDNQLVLPHGTSYKILVLPKQDTMRPETLRKIKQLVEQGATVLGPAPKRSPSMQNYPNCDQEVQKLTAELWGKVDGKSLKARKVGKGLILSGMDLKEALDMIKAAPDCVLDHPEALYVHRTIGNMEAYFITNQIDQPITMSPQFRVQGMIPEYWDAVTGLMRPLPAFVQKGALTEVPIKLDPFGSAFIVFRQKGKPQANGVEANFPTPKTVATLNNPWQVRFDKSKRGPEETITLEKLTDWTTFDNDAVKYYSGPATYTTTFELGNVQDKVFLNLGTVHIIADVKINGKDAGTLWTAPWQTDITPFLQQGNNTVEITVTNTWANRLIGDAGLQEDKRPTWLTINPYKPDQKLFPAGLIGPVTLQTSK